MDSHEIIQVLFDAANQKITTLVYDREKEQYIISDLYAVDLVRARISRTVSDHHEPAEGDEQ